MLVGLEIERSKSGRFEPRVTGDTKQWIGEHPDAYGAASQR